MKSDERKGIISGLRRFFHNRVYFNLAVALSVVAIVVLVAVFAEEIAPFRYMEANMKDKLQGPNMVHLFGTDPYGRDLFSRVICGLRIALKVAVISIGIQLSLGIVIGLSAGYFGGKVDRVLSFVMEVFMSIPSMILAFTFVTVLGSDLNNAIIAVALASWPNYARVIRTKTMEIKNSAYIKIALTYGESHLAIMVRYILPNLLSPIIELSSTRLPNAIVSTTALSFLGLGAQSPSPDWGLALSEAVPYVTTAPWLCVFPGLALVLLTYMFSVVGEAVRDAFNPNMRES